MKTEQIEFTFLELNQQAKKQAITNYNINYHDLCRFFESVIIKHFKRTERNNEVFNKYVYPVLESFVIQDFDYQKDLLLIDFGNYVITDSPFQDYVINPFADRFCMIFLKWLKETCRISDFKLNMINEALNDNGIEIEIEIDNNSNVTITYFDVYNTFHCDNDLCLEVSNYINQFIRIINTHISIIVEKCFNAFEYLANNEFNSKLVKFNKYGYIVLHNDEDSILNHYCDYMYRNYDKDFLFGCDGYDYYIDDIEYGTRHYLTMLKIHEIENTSDSDLFNIEFED